MMYRMHLFEAHMHDSRSYLTQEELDIRYKWRDRFKSKYNTRNSLKGDSTNFKGKEFYKKTLRERNRCNEDKLQLQHKDKED